MSCDIEFQSRNRESFDFRAQIVSDNQVGLAFQSRNRESFDFRVNSRLLLRMRCVKTKVSIS